MALIDDCIVNYSFEDDAANTTVTDSVGTYDTTLGGGDNTEDVSAVGKIDKCFDFNGSDDYIDCGSAIFPTDGSNWSFSFWFEYHTVAADEYILSQYEGGGSGRTAFLYIDANDGLYFYNVDAGNILVLAAPISAGLHHAAGTYDGTNVKIYIDNVLKATIPSLGNIRSVNTFIGARKASPSDQNFEGKIDEVVIFDDDIGSAGVSSLYNSGDGLFYPFTTGPDFTKVQINIGDTWKAGADMKINIGDTWKDVAEIKQNIGDTWKDVL